MKKKQTAAKFLNDLGVKTPIIAMGEQGPLYEHGLIPAFNGRSVETTGAGDAFNGGFAVALSEGKSALRMLNSDIILRPISVTRAGTAPSMPARISGRNSTSLRLSWRFERCQNIYNLANA